MKTLRDYELQRGDWVKFYSSGWREFKGKENGLYCFYDGEYDVSGGAEIQVVLRPSVIIRDELDRYLKEIEVYTYGECQPLATTEDGVCLFFKQIHPKEEKKSLEKKLQEAYSNPCNVLAPVFLEMAAEIDKLKEEKK